MKNTRNKLKIGIIIWSTRSNLICRSIAKWIMQEMQHENLELGLIDLADVNLPFLDEPNIPAHHDYQKDHTKAWSKIISSYDGFVIVFPQYNCGYPAVLKNAIDFLYDEWIGKPVSLICYGNHGGAQGFLAMRLVTQGLKMCNMATNPSLVIDSKMFDELGQFKDIETAFAKYRQQMRAISEEFVSTVEVQNNKKSS